MGAQECTTLWQVHVFYCSRLGRDCRSLLVLGARGGSWCALFLSGFWQVFGMTYENDWWMKTVPLECNVPLECKLNSEGSAQTKSGRNPRRVLKNCYGPHHTELIEQGELPRFFFVSMTFGVSLFSLSKLLESSSKELRLASCDFRASAFRKIGETVGRVSLFLLFENVLRRHLPRSKKSSILCIFLKKG